MPASVTVKSGDVFTGIFYGAVMDNQESAYLLKMVEKAKAGSKAELNGIQDSPAGFIGRGEDFAMSFDTKEVIDLAVEGINFETHNKMQNGRSSNIVILWDLS